jgi:hypothetical protein
MSKEERRRLIKNEEKNGEVDGNLETVQEEEVCDCSCKKMWKSYKSCIEFSCLGFFALCTCFKKTLYNCCGFCFFPIKERFSTCCDNVDTDLNPYKNPNYNPYDHL